MKNKILINNLISEFHNFPLLRKEGKVMV